MFFKKIFVLVIIILLVGPVWAEENMKETDCGCTYKLDKDGAIIVQSEFEIPLSIIVNGKHIADINCTVLKGSRVKLLDHFENGNQYFRYLQGPQGLRSVNPCEDFLIKLKEFPINEKEIRHTFCPKKPSEKKNPVKPGRMMLSNL